MFGEYDVWRFAAQLQRDPFEIARRQFHRAATYLGRAGQGNLADMRMGDQGLTNRSARTGHDL